MDTPVGKGNAASLNVSNNVHAAGVTDMLGWSAKGGLLE